MRLINSGNSFGFPEVNTFDQLLDSNPQAVILANPTSMHSQYLEKILGRGIHVLVEKPLVSSKSEVDRIEGMLSKYSGVGMIAYNMRFHPCIKKTKGILNAGRLGRIYSARLYVGQYLPDWRPGKKYSEAYSSKRELGGGAIFDLIHEIDLGWELFGVPLEPIVSLVDQVSDLDINVEDLVEILYRTNSGTIVSLHLDYLTRGYKRDIHIMAERGTLEVDIFRNQITYCCGDEKPEVYNFEAFEKNDMYVELLSTFLESISSGRVQSPTLMDGLISNRIAVNIRSQYYEQNGYM